MNNPVFRIAIPLAIVLIGGLVSAYLVSSRPEARPNPPAEKIYPVRVVSPRRGPKQATLLVYGEITSGREAEIRAMVAGRLVELNPGYRNGAYVAAGARLGVIDPFEYEVAVREQQAATAEALARLAELQSELDNNKQLLQLLDEQIVLRQRDADRVQSLVKRNQSSEKAYDEAKLALNAARQQRVQGQQAVDSLVARIQQQRAVFDGNQAKLDRAHRDLSYTKLEAPFSGFLQDVAVAIGKRVAVGEGIGRLIDAAGLEARFEMPNADYSRLVAVAASANASTEHPLVGTEIQVVWRLGDKSYVYPATIDRTGAEIDSGGGGVVLYARITGGLLGILRPGAFVEVSVPDVVYDDVIVLPESAVADDGTVYVIVGSRLEARDVDVVREFGGEVYVRANIGPDVSIVAEQFPAIGPGLRVHAL